MTEDIRFSRTTAAAARLGDEAEDRHRFLDKTILLTGELAALETANGRSCFMASLLLLPRICRNISVCVPQSVTGLEQEARLIAARISFDQQVRFISEVENIAGYDAILSIGAATRPEFPWTVINANGWLARISSGSTNLQESYSQENPISALAAACLGVADVFKRLLGVKTHRGRMLDGLSFSLFDYRTGTDDPGPALPDDMPTDLLLVGAGAIGNGVLYLLQQLPLSGQVWIVDKQTYGPENLGTCLLIGPGDVGIAKATFAAQWLSPQVDAEGFADEVSAFAARLSHELPYPRIVIGALDDIAARHSIQDMWPDMVVDGAISDFACQVSRHPWGEDIACLRCLFVRRQDDEPAERAMSRATGLSEARAQAALQVVTEDDVYGAPVEKQDWLRRHIGHQICSVVAAATAQQVAERQQRDGFDPSVPFVACLSASMVVAEVLKYLVGWPTPLEPRFQLDSLQGPAHGQSIPQQRRRECICVARAENIEKIRRRRPYLSA